MIIRPHWSYSQLAQYLRCPLQYYFERVAKLPRPFVASGMALGSAVHTSLAEYHLHVQQNQAVPDGHIQQTFVTALANQVQSAPIQFRNGETKSELIDDGVALIEMYLSEPPPRNIVGIEQQFIVPIRNSAGEFLEKPLVAIVDLLTKDESGLTVTELKTASKRYSDNGADRVLQATCYRHAVEERFDEPASVTYKVLVRTKTPTLQEVEADRDFLDAGRLGDVIETVERAIAAEAYYPIASAMNCATCPFYKPCREWTGRQPVEEADPQRQTNRGRELVAC
ncbi:MAG: PD-(D/E)XK nuclease family protein [Pirellulales bacterium]|nr:PD-(D/E)XK nuclease family protein [Pirellulales bacterium]